MTDCGIGYSGGAVSESAQVMSRGSRPGAGRPPPEGLMLTTFTVSTRLGSS